MLKQKRYPEATAILETLPDDPQAQKWLTKLYSMSHMPQNQSLAPSPNGPEQQNRQVILSRKQQLFDMVTKAETAVHRLERQVSELDERLREIKKDQNGAGWLLLIGLFLAPVGIGLVLIILALLGNAGSSKEEKKIIKQRAEVLAKLDRMREYLTRLKLELQYTP